MSKTRTLAVAGIASLAMALSALGSATSASALAPTPKLPNCYPPECYYV